MKSFGDAAATVNNQDNLMQQQQSVQVKEDDHFSWYPWSAIGKGLAGALHKLFHSINIYSHLHLLPLQDKNKKRKFNDDDMKKTLWEKGEQIDRRDEFGRIVTEKQVFKALCHKFHGKGPGKAK